jgi:hypothetical protein
MRNRDYLTVLRKQQVTTNKGSKMKRLKDVVRFVLIWTLIITWFIAFWTGCANLNAQECYFTAPRGPLIEFVQVLPHV